MSVLRTAGITGNSPLIGWKNIVPDAAITAGSSEVGFPATNVATPATHQRWRPGLNNSNPDYLQFLFSTSALVDYVGIAAHNIGSSGASLWLEGNQGHDTFTKLSVHFEGEAGSQVFVDDSTFANVLTAVGNAQITKSPVRIGQGAGTFDGTGDYITIPDTSNFSLGSSNFTFEAWFLCTATSGSVRRLMGQIDSGFAANDSAWGIYRETTNVLRFALSTGSNFSTFDTASAFTDTINPGWHHIAVCRNGNVIRIFIDGVLETVGQFSGAAQDSTEVAGIGSLGGYTGEPWLGQIDEVRWSIGTDRYGLTPFEGNDSFTKVLLNFNRPDASTVIEDQNLGGSPHTWTAAGNAQIDSVRPKFGLGSLLLDGTGDWVSASDHADFTLGSGAWTIDCWVKPAADGTQIGIGGQSAAGLAAADTSWLLERMSNNLIRFYLSTGSAFVTVTSSSTVLAAGGWVHIAIIRTGDILRLFINGVQEGGDIAFTGAVNDSVEDLRIGAQGEFTGTPWNGWIDGFRLSVGVARWTAAFTPPAREYGVIAFPPPMRPFPWTAIYETRYPSNAVLNLRFDAADGSTNIIDDLGQPWIAIADAHIDAGDSKFGQSSLLLDGTGDYVQAIGSPLQHLDSNDFTVEAWVLVASTLGSTRVIIGRTRRNSSGAAQDREFVLFRNSLGQMTILLGSGAAQFQLSGTTIFTDTQNIGWHHVAATRSGNTVRIFVDGIQENSNTLSTAVNATGSGPISVGRNGDEAFSSEWLGRIDEVRLIVGEALYTENFDPEETHGRVFTTDAPVVFQFPQAEYQGLRLGIAPGGFTELDAPTVGVVFMGEILELPRRIYVGHQPGSLNRESEMLAGRSETGQYLGRVIRRQFQTSNIEMSNIPPLVYRSDLKPWIENSETLPFFFAWRPQTYPDEVIFCWATQDGRMTNERPNGMVQMSLPVQGISP